MGAFSAAGILVDLVTGWRGWLTAIRAVEDNPLARLLVRFRQDRQGVAFPLGLMVRRWLLRIIAAALVAAVVMTAAWELVGFTNRHFVSQAYYLAVLSLGVVYTFFSLLPAVFRAVKGVLDAVSPVVGKQPLGLVKDLFGTSVVGDREIVTGVLRAHLPPLARVIFQGACVIAFSAAMWDILELDLPRESHEVVIHLGVMLLAVLSITLSGILAALLMVLALIAFGAGLRTGENNWLIAVSWCLVQLVYIAGVWPWCRLCFWEWMFFDNQCWAIANNAVWVGGFLAAIIAYSVFYFYQLELRRTVARVIPFSMPFLFMASCVAVIICAEANYAYNDANRAAAEVGILYSWGVFPLLNPFAVPVVNRCVSFLTYDELWIKTTVWPQYFLMLLGQLALITIAANFARRAVGRLRSGYD